MTRLCKFISCIWICAAYRVKQIVAVLAVLALCLLAGRAFSADTYDMTVYANEDFILNLQFKADGVPENITGRTYKLQAKKTAAAAPFLTFSTAIVNAANGQTRHWLTRATTRNNSSQAGIYDLMETTPDNKVNYRMRGSIRILETVTR